MTSIKETLAARLTDGSGCVGIVGLGYVGLPLALCFSESGLNVVGFDIDPNKIRMLRNSESYFDHIDCSRIKEAIENGLVVTSEYSSITKVDAIILCLPTPLGNDKQPDLSFVTETFERILPYLRSGQIISLESTTYPGTTEEELLPRINSSGLTVGEEIFLVYSPEREDPGNQNYGTRDIPKICAGYTENCLSVGTALYQKVVREVIPVSSLKIGEMAKLLENIYRSVNIGMINEMKQVADAMDINIHEVIAAASTKPFGFSPFYPGPGLGGHCIPIDPFYLSWKARMHGVDSRFIELAGEVNTGMPGWVVEKLEKGLENQGKRLAGASVLVLGIAYKKNIDDMRESPGAAILQILSDAGANPAYSDPHVPSFPPMRNYRFDLQSISIEAQLLREFDAAILVTDHDSFDYNEILQHSNLVVDTRGKYSAIRAENLIHA